MIGLLEIAIYIFVCVYIYIYIYMYIYHQHHHTYTCIQDGGGDVVAKSFLTLATPWTVACQFPLSIHGIFQARILERVAISFYRRSS